MGFFITADHSEPLMESLVTPAQSLMRCESLGVLKYSASETTSIISPPYIGYIDTLKPLLQPLLLS